VTTHKCKLQVDGPDSAFTAHFGQGQSNGSGVFGGISLGYAENGNNSYRKVGIVSKALGDGAARQNLHFLVDTVSDGNNANLTDTKMMINGLTGNVGIGTDEPAKKLDVACALQSFSGASTDEGAVIRLTNPSNWENGYDGNGFLGGIEFYSGDTSESGPAVFGAIKQRMLTYYNDTAMCFFTSPYNGSLTERIRITATGQVQFPRTGQPPITNSLYGNIVLQTNAVTNFQRIRFDVGTTAYWGLTKLNTGNFAITGGSTWNDHAFELQYATGNVQVNETVGQRRFNVYDASDAWIRLYCGSTADWIFGANGSDHTFKWYNQSSNGGVGYKMAIATSGTLTVSADVIAFGSPSDIRLKENIKPIESALDKVSKLQGVTFDWKKSDSILDIKEDIGFIAQDVQKVIPELVRENEDCMLSMRHQGIAPILLEAIKELKQEIEKLKNKPCNCNCK